MQSQAGQVKMRAQVVKPVNGQDQAAGLLCVYI